MLVLTAAVLATAGCGRHVDPQRDALTQASACGVVKDRLNADTIEKRFGKPDEIQDFFGDKVVTYKRDGVEWSFQVSGKVGTYRALRQRPNEAEEILPCRT